MSCISLLKLGFTLKKIDLSVFSSLQRYFLSLPDFLLFNRASAPAKSARRSPIRKENGNLWIQKEKEVQSKADHNSVYCFFLTVFRLAIPAFFSKPENMQDRRPRFLQLISFSNFVDARKSGYDVILLRPSVQDSGLWIKRNSIG